MKTLTPFHHVFAPGDTTRTLVLLHGTGGNEHDLLPLGRTLLPGAALISPRGQVLENGAPRFFRRFAEGVFDIEDLKLRTEELAEFLRSAKSEHGLGDLVAVGFSNGANIGASILLRHADVFAGAVLFRAMTPFVPETFVTLPGTPVLITSGRSDPIVPEASVNGLVDMLRQAGAQVQHEWVSTGHGLTNTDLSLAQRWIASTR